MAVHRRGLDPVETPRTILSLGRVLVTIDDLAALVALIGEHDGQSFQVEIEFHGGTIDAPSDLRELSNDEMGTVSIKTTEIEVLLSSRDAQCIGDPNIAKLVYTRWARPRQLRIEVRWRAEVMAWAFAIPIAILAGAVWIISATNHFDSGTPLPVAVVAAIVSILTIVAMLSEVRTRFAKLYPGTLDEYRKEQLIGKRQLVTWLIAVSAIAVSTTTALVTVLITK